jgi:hypothetical protein
MSTIYFDAWMRDDERRRKLYQGDFFVFSPTKSSLEQCEFAQELAKRLRRFASKGA